MINTDKYKGHTPAPWFHYDDGGISSSIRLYHQPYMNSDGDDTEEDLAEIHYDENCIADARLIADAPLLLAEVQRLRELFSIDEGSRDEGYCITMRLEGCEYIGTLRLYKDEEGKVIE